MEIRVSSQKEAPKEFHFVELLSPVRKPFCKLEEIDALTDFDSDELQITKDEMCEPECAEVERSIIKSIFLDDKAKLVIEANRLLKTTSQCLIKSTKEAEPYVERADCGRIVSKLLRSCCLCDSVECATALLNGEVFGTTPLVNEMDESGLSPLHTAATVHAVKCIELLLSKKARTDIKSKDERSQVALELSLTSRRMDVVWKVGDPIEDLLVCLNQKNLAAVRQLAEKTKEIGEVGYSIAIKGQAVSLAALLMVASEKVLFQVVDVGYNGDCKEKITIYDCLMKEVLALGRKEYSSSLTWSTHPSKTFSFTNDTDTSAESLSLRRKLLLCEMELCQLFGASPQTSLGDKKIVSPLIYAIQAADLEVIKLLLESGINVGEADAQGNSALHWALKMNSALCLKQIKIIGLLLEHGARVTQKNKLGLTALHIAASNGNFQAVQILLSEEPNSVHSVTEMKETPLFLAVKNDHKECVELLLCSGANSEVLNIRKQRPIDFAKSQDMRFTLSPTNIRLSHTSQHQQKIALDGNCVSGEISSVLSTLKNENSVIDSSRKIEPCKYFMSSHGCARGAKCFYVHDEEYGPPKRGRHLSCSRSSELRRKIYVGGLPASIDSGSLGKFFEHFGSVENAIVVQAQRCDQPSRGFGFVTFKNEKSVTVAVQAHYILIMGKEVEINSCLPGSPSFDPDKVSFQQEIDEECDVGLQTLCSEVKKPDEHTVQTMSWVDKLFQNQHDTSPPGPQAQAGHSISKGKEPEWLNVFKKWFPSFMKKKFKSLGQGEFYALSSLKADFRATCGFELNHSSIGYPKLSQFLASVTDICHVKYAPEKGKGSESHMVLVANRSMSRKRPTDPVKSPGANSPSELSDSSIDAQCQDSKFIQDVASLSVDLKRYDLSDGRVCGLFEDLFTESPLSSLDHKSAANGFVPRQEYTIWSSSQSYKNQAHSGALSSVVKVGFMDPFEDKISPNSRFLQFLSPDPLFHSRPWINNESCNDSLSAESKRHSVLEDFARRNNVFSYFLRDFDFYTKYYKCHAEEKCFSCTKQRMSWENYPCGHLLWCDACRSHVVEAARGSDHKCVICDAKVQKLLHNHNPTSWSKVIQPQCLPIMDYNEFNTLDAHILGSPSSSTWKIENLGCQFLASYQMDRDMDGCSAMVT